jgi:HK97 family phage major capsid protein
MSDELKRKLAQVEDDLSALRDERAEAVKARDAAKEAFASADGYDTNSDEFKAAQDAVRAVGEIDDRIADAQSAQVGILKMLGQEDPKVARAREDARRESRQRTGQEPVAGWETAELFAADGVREALERASASKSRFGSIELGEVAARDSLAADIGGTTDMRLGTYRGILPQIFRPLRVLDLIPTGTTDGNVVPYTQEGGTFTAAETAESAAKPEGGVTFVDATAPVQTIAAWQKIRKQALSDVAALQSIISGRLRYSVQRRLEGQVLNGDGVGSNLTGILQTSGIGSVAFDATKPLTELVLSGITGVFLADAEASGIVMNPRDWQTSLTQKANYTASAGVTGGSGEYIGGGPFSVTPQIMWGIPLLASPAIPQGTALVGDFAIGAQLLIREGVNVLFSDSDQDDFIKNRVTLLGEMRAALPVWRPVAFQKVALA